MVSVEMYVEREDEEIQIEVYGKYDPGERVTRNHPGYGPGAEFSFAEFNGKRIILTTDEIDKAQAALDKAVANGEFED